MFNSRDKNNYKFNNLYTLPLYKGYENSWAEDYARLVDKEPELSIDITSITSFLSVGQFSKNRTLFNEIKRLPWLAEPLPNGAYKELQLPKHDFKTGTDDDLAKLLFQKLCDEARAVSRHNPKIYILLTGGLDSRIIAGVYSYLYNNGELKEKPKCLTWGIENSRDVYYAKLMAEHLDFDWQRIPLNPDTVMQNIKKCGQYLGMLHSPEMLHSMLWFKNLPSDAMVIAGSFGDSIGRGEFSSLHLLQLEHKQPKNTYNLLQPEVYKIGAKGLNNDLQHIHRRGGRDTLNYMQCEYWMQGYRMRNGLCHALSVINRSANIYQMFTAPEVYGFMWSLHPSRRDDNIYNALLKNHFPKLAEVPWARNNKSIKGNYKNTKLKPHYHEYTKWSSGELYQEIKALVDPNWFMDTGLFTKQSIAHLNEMVSKSQERVGRLNDIWLWLAGFRFYIDQLKSEGKTVKFGDATNYEGDEELSQKQTIKKSLVLLASKSKLVNKTAKHVRKTYRDIDLSAKKKEMIKKHPPKPYEI